MVNISYTQKKILREWFIFVCQYLLYSEECGVALENVSRLQHILFRTLDVYLKSRNPVTQ
jgi:hypothetical protein